MHRREWFEMEDLRKRRLLDKVWVPLHFQEVRKGGSVRQDGWEEYTHGYALVVRSDDKVAIMREDVFTFGAGALNCGVEVDGSYREASKYYNAHGSVVGEYLVIKQHLNTYDGDRLHLSQDLVMALGLAPERRDDGMYWVRPSEGYCDVVRMIGDVNSRNVRVEIKKEFLMDYLSARNSGLFLCHYSQKWEDVPNRDHIGWGEDQRQRVGEFGRWEGYVRGYDRNGLVPGEGGICILHEGRTDVDRQVDVPTFGPPTESNSFVHRRTVEAESTVAYYHVLGECFDREWLDNNGISTRIRWDKERIQPFVANGDGTERGLDEVVHDNGYLWFDPSVIDDVLAFRGTQIKWHTQDTASIEWSPDLWMRFGINQVGLINVFAEDISHLPKWQRDIWRGKNVAPEGGVSSELLASQQEANPARTVAAERVLGEVLTNLNNVASPIIGTDLFKHNEKTWRVYRQIHRTAATNKDKLISLALNIARLTADAIDSAALKKFLNVSEPRIGSLKLLQQFVAQYSSPSEAEALMAPLFHAYDMRLEGAHPLSSQEDERLAKLVGDTAAPFVLQGKEMIRSVVTALVKIWLVIVNDGRDPSQQVSVNFIF